ncbi:MAG: NAD(P)H-hydrate dehydratase [Fibrobacterales bacterium]
MKELEMAEVVTVSEMQGIDAAAIDGDYAVGYHYMKRAGEALYAKSLEIIADNGLEGTVDIFCGKGNNGGDGFVLAALLKEKGVGVRCYSVAAGGKLMGEAAQAFKDAIDVGVDVLPMDPEVIVESFVDTCLIIDALLGTGMKGNPKAPLDQVIGYINNSGILILSVDSPSGVNNERGIPGDPCVEADYTVTMGFAKVGSLFYPLRDYYGELTIADLTYPEDIVEQESAARYVIDDTILEMVPLRTPWGDKVDHGVVLVLAGSKGMLGAATLASQAALRTGCGMVHLAAPDSAIDTLSIKLTEPVLHGLPQTEAGTLSLKGLSTIREYAEKASALCIGPGLSTHPETAQLVKALVKTVNIGLVIDADGLNALADSVDVLKEARADIVLTPHAEEYRRLFGKLPIGIEEKVDAIQATAEKYDITIVYKGYPTIVATPDSVYFNPYGNSGMATAGSGDVLSGVITSLIAQGCSVKEAALLGTYIHTTAGDVAAEELSEYSMIASDIVDAISQVMVNSTGIYG